MKELKIFSWINFGLAAACLLIAHIEALVEWAVHWKLAALIFVLAAVLSLLVVRALKQFKEDWELKELMRS